ncbi:MAG: GNAT family N-acetyltransferase [Pseudoxanthomonas sp.]
MGLVIRNAVEADIPAIAAIYAAEVRDFVNTYEYDPPDEAEMLQRMRGVLADGYPWLSAELDGQLAGYAYAGAFRSRDAYRWVVENSVYVAAGRQGHGIGSALLAKLIAECEARDFRQMIAVIGEATNTASIKLHERFGFRHLATMPGIAWKHGRWLDTVFMQRGLGEGNRAAPSVG